MVDAPGIAIFPVSSMVLALPARRYLQQMTFLMAHLPLAYGVHHLPPLLMKPSAYGLFVPNRPVEGGKCLSVTLQYLLVPRVSFGCKTAINEMFYHSDSNLNPIDDRD
jgi:hypothetical protein